MPVRTAYAGAAVSGEVLTAANVNKMPGGWIGYAEATTNQGAITTAVDLTSLTVTVTAGTSRRLRISGRVLISSSVDGDIASLAAMEGATTLNTSQSRMSASATMVVIEAVVTPTAGSHTYKLQAARAAGTGSLSTLASATAAAFIAVEDLGPAT